MTDYLRALASRGDPLQRLVPLLAEALRRTGARQVVDLGSGAGGPWSHLQSALEEELGAEVQVLLTDLYPHQRPEVCLGAGERLQVVAEPVDVTRVPAWLEGFRTMFSLFHHFPPAQARAILRDAVEAGQGIGVFEVTERSARAVLLMATSFPFMWMITPWIRPFRWWRLLLTYLVPAIPLVTIFDGIISCLRTYRPEEMLAMAQEVSGDRYRWEVRSVNAFPPSPIPVTALIGTPEAG